MGTILKYWVSLYYYGLSVSLLIVDELLRSVVCPGEVSPVLWVGLWCWWEDLCQCGDCALDAITRNQ